MSFITLSYYTSTIQLSFLFTIIYSSPPMSDNPSPHLPNHLLRSISLYAITISYSTLLAITNCHHPSIMYVDESITFSALLKQTYYAISTTIIMMLFVSTSTTTNHIWSIMFFNIIAIDVVAKLIASCDIHHYGFLC